MTMLPLLGELDLAERLQAALGGAYVVEREIGAGGMSRVFLATRHGGTERAVQVAVKVLSPAVASCCDAERFRLEMDLAATLRHPNIVPLIEVCAVCGGEHLFYFVMPFAGTETLRARLLRDGPLPVVDALNVLRDIASALAYAHEQGVVHRDIKPANVLLSGGRALLTDFGIAKALVGARFAEPSPAGHEHGNHDACRFSSSPDLTAAGFAVGTPAYAAPEQSAGDASTDHRADLYALGVLAYEMLTGTPPFTGASSMAIIAAHFSAPPSPIGRADVPPRLATLIMQLLEKDPQARPQSADDVLRDLAHIP